MGIRIHQCTRSARHRSAVPFDDSDPVVDPSHRASVTLERDAADPTDSEESPR